MSTERLALPAPRGQVHPGSGERGVELEGGVGRTQPLSLQLGCIRAGWRRSPRCRAGRRGPCWSRISSGSAGAGSACPHPGGSRASGTGTRAGSSRTPGSSGAPGKLRWEPGTERTGEWGIPALLRARGSMENLPLPAGLYIPCDGEIVLLF